MTNPVNPTDQPPLIGSRIQRFPRTRRTTSTVSSITPLRRPFRQVIPSPSLSPKVEPSTTRLRRRRHQPHPTGKDRKFGPPLRDSSIRPKRLCATHLTVRPALRARLTIKAQSTCAKPAKLTRRPSATTAMAAEQWLSD